MTGSHLDRARMLLRAGRSEDAAREATFAATESPDDAAAHELLALALADLDERDEALEAADRAIGLAPEDAHPHYVRASVLLRFGKPKRALLSAEEAVRLDPDDENHHSLMAAALCGLSRWTEARDAAQRGLEIDPEHVQCTNLRALALRQLGEVDEAEAVLRSSLAADPENAWTLQNLGFAALKAGRHDEAIAHFRESLRLDPTDELSRFGLAEAIKARVPLYRPVIAWQMFASKLSARMGFGLIIGFFVLNAVLRTALPEGSWIRTTLLVAYVSLVWMSWAASALFDVLLLLRSSLRPILQPRERVASALVVSVIVLAAVLLVLRFTTNVRPFELPAMAAAFAAIPIAGAVALPNGKARAVGTLMAAGALVTLIASTVLMLVLVNSFGWDAHVRVTLQEQEDIAFRMDRAVTIANASLLISVLSTWVLLGLGFVPESRGGRGTRRRPRA